MPLRPDMPLTTPVESRALGLEDIAAGQVFEARECFGGDHMDRFAELSGDFSAIHTNAGIARDCGFPDRVMYGFLLLSLISRIVGVHFDRAVCGSISMDFVQPVFPAEPVVVAAEVTQVQPATRSVVLKIQIRRGENIVARGKLTVVFLRT